MPKYCVNLKNLPETKQKKDMFTEISGLTSYEVVDKMIIVSCI